ncbi:MAG: MFS transporter [Alphaproteobacteria bacterium]|nr:MFS transporter [Alphaproteobacteria bacterium]MBU1757000.1 MFS transporter [Alphaproteobacteria bacterium]MBU2033886.1 MFS transporter [Alphaproteobacteria bacterium]MBU2340549.1 MFS transporter [Alphaproteobacteria bacterium]
MSNPEYLTRRQELLLALAAAVVTANAYYIHPIIGEVAEGFGVSTATIGLVPALNQLALAVGIFLLLPLGDRFSNRRLTVAFTIGQCVGLGMMTLAQDFVLFTAGSTLLGFFTIAPYLLPAYASKRVAPERLGHVTATLTAGVIFGILIARVGAGVVAEYFSWRAVYWIASGAMIAIAIALPRIMPRLEATRDKPTGNYFALVMSVFPLLRSHREILLSGLIQGIGFAQFIALWLGLALHLTSPEMGYGTDVVGYLAGFAAISILSTPRLGTLADKFGARRARFYFSLVQTAGIALLIPFGNNLWLLMIPIFFGNLVGPAIDVTSRMTFLSLAPGLRTRLTTIYIVMMFIGGAIGSIAGTAIYDFYGWTGTALYVFASCLAIVAISLVSWRMYGRSE